MYIYEYIFECFKIWKFFVEREREVLWEDNGNGSEIKWNIRVGVGDREVER